MELLDWEDDDQLDPDWSPPHLDLLRKVLGAHRKSGILINAKKSKLFRASVEYLGYDVSSQGVKLPEKALRDIQEWPTPSDKREVGTLLGFLGYYREFIPEFACLTAGMSSLRSKNVVFQLFKNIPPSLPLMQNCIHTVA